jgi:hypothetical protein
MGGGWQRITKLYGAIVLNGERYVWDYHQDVGVHEREMPKGSKRWKLSEKAKAKLLSDAAQKPTMEEK